MLSKSYLYFSSFNLPLEIAVDPAVEFLGQVIGHKFGAEGWAVARLIVSVSGLVLLFMSLGYRSFRAVELATATASWGVLSFGLDYFAAFSLHWLPWLLSSLIIADRRAYFLPLVICFGVIFSLTAGPSSVLALVMIFPIAILYSCRRSTIAAIVGLILLAVTVLNAPMLDIPGSGRVAPFSQVVLSGYSLLGPRLIPDPLIAPILIEQLQAKLSIILLLALLLFVVVPRVRWVTATIAAIIIAEAVLPESLETPFKFLLATVPGLELIPIPTVVLAVWLLVSVPIWRVIEREVVVHTVFIVSLLFATFVTVSGSWSVSYLGNVEPKVAWTRLVERAYGSWIYGVDKVSDLSQDIKCTATSNVHQSWAKLVWDSDEKSRWHTGRPQRTGDYLKISCDEEIRFTGIRFGSARYPTDFPRGFRVLAPGAEGAIREVFRQDDWLGALQWSPSGVPYFDRQAEVLIRFPGEIITREITIELTAGDPQFDWSVAEVEVFH